MYNLKPKDIFFSLNMLTCSKRPWALAIILVFHLEAFTQELLLYKQIDTVKLYLEVHRPNQGQTDKSPAIIFFFGGGWKTGSRGHFLHHAKYFAQRGITCFLADYRTLNKHGTTPFQALKDAKSAMRYLRKNADVLRIQPDSIIASGGSAGGHLAAATALITGYNDDSDDLSVSSIPNALVLFNPVIDNGAGGYGYDRISEAYPSFSPLHNIRKGAPPTLIFLGTEDQLIPVETIRYYQKIMEKVGSLCEVHLYPDAKHGFFNYRNPEYYQETVKEADSFLQSLGYLSDEPKIEIE